MSRREHDVSLARAQERVAELEAENDVLRDYIEKQAAERRAVIERYERLLDRRDAVASTDERSPTSSPSSAPTTGVVDALRGVVDSLRSRLSAALGRD